VTPIAPERGLRRFVETAMHSPFSLPVLGVSLLAAVAFGVHLGESSVGLINPIYFQAPPLHPRDRGAAIDERRLEQDGPVYAQLYGWEQGYAARAADCGNCEALQARDAYSARVPYFGSGGELRAAVTQARSNLGESFAEAPEIVVHRPAEVERYAHYRISEDQAEAEASPEPELAAEVVGLDDKKDVDESF
jgi:hypothetical protein